MTALITLLTNLIASHWHGEVTLKIEAGKIQNIRKNESLDVKKFNEGWA